MTAGQRADGRSGFPQHRNARGDSERSWPRGCQNRLQMCEALELDYLPQHLIVLGVVYVGLELPKLTVASVAA